VKKEYLKKKVYARKSNERKTIRPSKLRELNLEELQDEFIFKIPKPPGLFIQRESFLHFIIKFANTRLAPLYPVLYPPTHFSTFLPLFMTRWTKAT
jgi:hypothetical protein